MKEQRRQLTGVVVSDKMEKTVVVAVQRIQRHPLYRKVIRRNHRYKAHNEGNQARAGDVVRIIEARPMSREKRWVVEEILERAEA